MTSHPPGWYPDPTNPLQERLWDGSDWVDHVRDRATSAGQIPEQEQQAHPATRYASRRIARIRVIPVVLVLLVVGATLVTLTAVRPNVSLRVGDTGPGGGTVFFVSQSPFACGPVLEDRCTYLEVSPPSAEVLRKWTIMHEKFTEEEWPMPGSIDAYVNIGAGMRNSNSILMQVYNSGEVTAATYALHYRGGGMSDWHLPSFFELNELCKYARGVPTGDLSVACDSGTPQRYQRDFVLPTGFTAHGYWSSSQASWEDAWLVDFTTGEPVNVYKSTEVRVRPIRAG
jgi:hypothetical protein